MDAPFSVWTFVSFLLSICTTDVSLHKFGSHRGKYVGVRAVAPGKKR